MSQSEKKKLKEILEQHHIDLMELYQRCSNVPLQEIEIYYEIHIGFRNVLEKILETVNMLKYEKGDRTENYTLDTVYTRYIYG